MVKYFTNGIHQLPAVFSLPQKCYTVLPTVYVVLIPIQVLQDTIHVPLFHWWCHAKTIYVDFLLTKD